MREYHNDKLLRVTCNMCGESENMYNEDLEDFESEWRIEPYKEIDLVYGYGSELYDFYGIKFDLCEHCISNLTKQFVHSAETREYEIASEDGELFYRWKDSKDEL